LYPNGANAINGAHVGTCAGIDFSKYKRDGSDINPYAALTYDATNLIVQGMHYLFEQVSDVYFVMTVYASRLTFHLLCIARNFLQNYPLTGAHLKASIVNNVSIVGATGLVR
jgi:hypothetical protein